MLICIDSCVFIRGLHNEASDAAQLLTLVGPALPLVIPRLVVQEVVRNLTDPKQVKTFYQIFAHRSFAYIVEEPVPRELVFKYVELGLPEKADAFIGAFAEWFQVDYLISDNRHFLRQLKTEAYQIVDPDNFIANWEPENR
ncbi:MAG: hypothetical protein DWQ04_10565 [Chloroflexi bacterium]|nr:MAG: hypothetical protein DWQ04_10565 [Chloroflexota bacterium]